MTSRAATVVAALFAALLLAACSGSEPTLPVLAEDAVILAFGDSLTRGTGARLEHSYPAVLEGLSARKVVNAGIPGELSENGLERLAGVLDRVTPALLILCHGGNDMLRKKDLKRARDNLAAMIALARERGIAVLLLAVPSPGIWLSPATFYAELAAATDTPVELDAIAQILADAKLKSDPVHPNAAGYRKLAEKVHARLVRAGAL